MVITRAISRLLENVSFAHTTTSTPNNSEIEITTINMPRENIASTSSSVTNFVKLPIFWTSCPEAWFIQAEMQFSLHNIIDDEKRYQNVVISLPESVITNVIDIIQNNHSNDKYNQIKLALCKRFSLSDESRLNKLFSEISLGDKTPSELFRDMNLIAGNKSSINCDILYKLWIRQLPQNIQTQLVST